MNGVGSQPIVINVCGMYPLISPALEILKKNERYNVMSLGHNIWHSKNIHFTNNYEDIMLTTISTIQMSREATHCEYCTREFCKDNPYLFSKKGTHFQIFFFKQFT